MAQTSTTQTAGADATATGFANAVVADLTELYGLLAGTASAFAYKAAGASQTFSAATKITLDAEFHDTTNNFDSTTNYRFTAPVTGLYSIKLALLVSKTSPSGGDVVNLYLYKNGSSYILCEIHEVPATASGFTYVAVKGDFDIRLNAGDYIEMYASGTGTWSVENGGNAPTRMSVSLMRA